MTNLKKLSKNVVLAIDWAAAEYKYLEGLKDELKTVEGEKDIGKELKELRKAAKILHYVARAERRAYGFEEKVNRSFVELLPELEEHGISPQIILGFRDLVSSLRIENDMLVKFASWYDSALGKGLDKARAEAEVEKKLKEEHPQDAEKMHQAFLELLHQLQQQVADAENWIQGLEVTLKKGKELLLQVVAQNHLSLPEGYALLKKYSFPIEKYPSEAAFLAQHPDDLQEMAKAAGRNANGLFTYGLPAVNLIINERTWPMILKGFIEMTEAAEENAEPLFNFFCLPIIADTGIVNEQTWPELVKIVKITGGRDTYKLFRYGLPAIKLIINERNGPMILKGFIKMAKAAGRDVPLLFQHVLPIVADTGIINEQTWPVIVEGFVEIANADNEHAYHSFFFHEISAIVRTGIMNLRIWKGLIEITKAAGKDTPNYFGSISYYYDHKKQYGIPYYTEQIFPGLVEIAKATKLNWRIFDDFVQFLIKKNSESIYVLLQSDIVTSALKNNSPEQLLGFLKK
ncbi:MAG: hypothetical protein Q7K45_03360, partial [Nanoarchaeota archaeon]|nr:hypothetical protein [Nanoarchaeota archaeon]